jgi:CRP/FNR family cyclic AMP-dependent transcriptional regulator
MNAIKAAHPRHVRNGQLPEALFASLFAGQPLERRAGGEMLFIQDDEPARVFGVVSGAVEISLYSTDGRKIVANIETPCSLVGEIGALDGGTRTASATCIGDCEMYSLARTQFLERITGNDKLAAAIIAMLCARIRWISSEFGDQVLLKVDARLAKRLLFLSSGFAGADGWVGISQVELASFLGTTRESVNKMLNQWRARGLIDIRRNGIRIVDANGLRGAISRAGPASENA